MTAAAALRALADDLGLAGLEAERAEATALASRWEAQSAMTATSAVKD